jgi:hypothetical protein
MARANRAELSLEKGASAVLKFDRIVTYDYVPRSASHRHFNAFTFRELDLNPLEYEAPLTKNKRMERLCWRETTRFAQDFSVFAKVEKGTLTLKSYKFFTHSSIAPY